MKEEKEMVTGTVSEERDKAKEYMKKFTKASNFNKNRQEAYAELMAFYQGNQHLLKTYKKDQPWLISMNTPDAAVAIDNRVSSLLANDYIGEIFPTKTEDVDAVNALNSLYRNKWNELNLDMLVREAIDKASVVREAYVHICVDDEKELNAYFIEPSAVYIDPNARSLSKARYVFVADRLSKEEAKQNYKIFDDLGDGNFTPEDRGEIYYDNDYTTSQDDIVTKLTYYGYKDKSKIEKVVLVNGIIVSTKEMGYKRLPIVQFRWKKAAQSCYGLSLMDDVLSLQKAVCAIESAITNAAVAYAFPGMIVARSSGLDPKKVAASTGAPGVVYVVNGAIDNALKPIVPPKIEGEIINVKANYENKIDKITGNSAQFLGDIGTAGNTKSGADTAVSRAKIIEWKVLNNIAEFVEELTNVLIEQLIIIFNGETVSVFKGKAGEGKYNFDEINVPDKETLTNLKYKYYIKLDTKTPFSKEKQKKELLDLFQFERQYDTSIKTVTVKDIIYNSDLENKDEIIERFNNLSAQDAQQKAETIISLTSAVMTKGLPQELLSQAISEVISSAKETPAVDEILNMLEQTFNQEMQGLQEEQQMIEGTMLGAPAEQPTEMPMQ